MFDKLKAAVQSRFGKVVLAGGLALAAAGGGMAMVAPSAGATTVSIHFCFKYANGTPYKPSPVVPGAYYQPGTVWLQAWNGSGWTLVKNANGANITGRTNSAGCANWTTTNGYRYFSVKAYWSYRVGTSITYYQGNTPYYVDSYAGGADLGTGIVGGPYVIT